MKKSVPVVAVILLALVASTRAYVEVPYSLGQVIRESTTIALVEVVKVDKVKNLVIYKKLEDIKGKHPTEMIKHNIGRGGFHPREWQNIMNWAEEGKKAVFFHNGGASETCMGTYWYQAYAQGEWWGMSHAEPFLLRTYCGDPEKLALACKVILKGEEVVVPAMQDGNKQLLHERKAKLVLMRASLKRANYDAKRDFVAFATGEEVDIDIPQFKTTVVLAESSPGWKYLPAREVVGESWKRPDFDDSKWPTGKAPLGYGEEEIAKRQGTMLVEKGVPFVFRRAVDIPAEVLQTKNATIKLNIASDNSADVWVNGEPVLLEGEADHEFAYWNNEIDVPMKVLRPGRNVIAALVRNGPASSDIFFDAELVSAVPLPKKTTPKTTATTPNPATTAKPLVPVQDNTPPKGLTVDKAKKTVTLECTIAPRKLPHLDKIYPIEVIACFPHPKGQKAHETVVTFTGFRPSHVHKALVECGLTPGKPAVGEGAKAQGPEVAVFLEFAGGNGQVQKLPIEKILVNTRTNQPVPPLRWHFTGSAMKNLDPEKDEKVYAADFTGTLLAIFPVTDDTVLQTSLTLKDEAAIKFEIAPGILPREGTAVRLIIEAR